MDDLLREFLTETNESLDTVDVELVRFEQEPEQRQDSRQHFPPGPHHQGDLRLPRPAAPGSAGARRRDADGQVPRRHAGDRRGRHAHPVDHRPAEGSARRARAERGRAGRRGRGPDRRARAHGDGRHRAGRCCAPKPKRRSPRRPPINGTLVAQTLERALRPGEVSLDELERAFRETAVGGRAGSRRPKLPKPRQAEARQGRAQAGRRGGRGQAGFEGRQPVDPRQRRDARTPDDHGFGAGADPQPAARDRAPARGLASSRCRCSASPTSPPSCRKAS